MSSRGVPEVLMKKVDEYVDSLTPQILPRITSELETFQTKTIDTLEAQVVDAFRSLFNKDGGGSKNSRNLDGAAPDSYGGQSLPFADEIAKLTRSFSDITDGASDDLRDIFDLTEGRGGSGENRSRGGGDNDASSLAKGFLSAAINAVQDHMDDNRGSGGQKFELDGLLGVLSNTVKDASRNPEEKARLISPEIKEIVGAKLREQHQPIAEQFTRIALDHIKRWLRGNVSTRDIGDGAKGEIEEQVKDLVKGIGGLFGSMKSSNEGSSRSLGDGDRDGDDGESGGGFSKVISDKLSTGLARVHREVRLEFRKILGEIEKQLFELLPDVFQRPLEKILGGNPFDSKLDRDAGSNTDRGFGDDIKAKLVSKIRDLVRKVQETLRESILGVVNGGHRKFERQSWVFVQSMVEQKVQKYLPKVKISVPDDIGNEGVSVGAPSTSTQQLGGGNKPYSQGGRVSPPPHEQHGGQAHTQQGYNRPSQDQRREDDRPNYHQQQEDYRPQRHESYQESRPQQHDSYHGSRPQQYDSYQESRPSQYQSPQQDHHQQYQSNPPQSYQHNQGYQQDQGYRQDQGYERNEGYQQNQDYQQNYGHRQNQGYEQDRRY
ncbi:uncharacterized protein DNG_02101 [Cephalotrichum gorgonifer]|uniref:Uncharacterized protein n=1 Tax=Cephalotrichum gorgonifer TaxID=2041049 RepID=A0AAE8MT10_9PEZI|nr:uncharacterized protein DNG_02101 [Cephalotrichum gorgonifer]